MDTYLLRDGGTWIKGPLCEEQFVSLSFLSSLQRRLRNVPTVGLGDGTDIPGESHLPEESGKGILGVRECGGNSGEREWGIGSPNSANQ